MRQTTTVTPGLTRGPASFLARLTPAGRELLKGLLIVPGALVTSIACLMVLADVVKGATP